MVQSSWEAEGDLDSRTVEEEEDGVADKWMPLVRGPIQGAERPYCQRNWPEAVETRERRAVARSWRWVFFAKSSSLAEAQVVAESNQKAAATTETRNCRSFY